jgi:hypothetical protein
MYFDEGEILIPIFMLPCDILVCLIMKIDCSSSSDINCKGMTTNGCSTRREPVL